MRRAHLLRSHERTPRCCCNTNMSVLGSLGTARAHFKASSWASRCGIGEQLVWRSWKLLDSNHRARISRWSWWLSSCRDVEKLHEVDTYCLMRNIQDVRFDRLRMYLYFRSKYTMEALLFLSSALDLSGDRWPEPWEVFSSRGHFNLWYQQASG